jgi:ferrous iron transport protein A
MTLTLDRLKINDKGRVIGLRDCDPVYRRRLLAMGLTKKTEFRVIRKAPLGDPFEIQIRDYLLSLRKEEAAAVMVEKI